MKNFNKHSPNVNRIALGLLFTVAGLVKLFAFKPAGVEGMLSGMGFPLPMFFAWVLILVELLGGLSLLFNYKARCSSYLLMVVMIVAAFTAYLPNFSDNLKLWSSFLLHLVAATNLWVIASDSE